MEETMPHDSSAKTASRRNARTCAGCGKHADVEELVRVVHDPGSGELAVDLAGTAFGRGGHVHPSPDCVAKALKGGFARVFKAKVVTRPASGGSTADRSLVADAGMLAAEIVAAADRRIEGLLTGARRAGQLAVGGDVVVEALRAGRAELVVVARDAAAATRLPEVERAIASGKAIALSDKARLGSLMARDEVAVLAVLHPGVAAAALQTFRMSASFRASGGSVAAADGSEEAWSSSEVR